MIYQLLAGAKLCLIVSINLFLSNSTTAQHQLSIYSGWTASTLQVTPSHASNARENPIAIKTLHAPYFLGLEYEHIFKKLKLSTGLSFILIGGQRAAIYSGLNQPVYYWIVPLLSGYQIKLPNNFGLTIEGGVDIGYQQWTSVVLQEPQPHVNLNAVVGIEAAWKRLRLGVRGQWGITSYQTYRGYTYRHLALTTYLGYTLWDQAKSKAHHKRKQ